MKPLLVITPKVDRDAVCHILVAETGEHLASHFCSHWTFAWGDLYAHRKERIEEWTKRFGEFEVKYLADTDISEDELVRRNREFYKDQIEKESSETAQHAKD